VFLIILIFLVLMVACLGIDYYLDGSNQKRFTFFIFVFALVVVVQVITLKIYLVF